MHTVSCPTRWTLVSRQFTSQELAAERETFVRDDIGIVLARAEGAGIILYYICIQFKSFELNEMNEMNEMN